MGLEINTLWDGIFHAAQCLVWNLGFIAFGVALVAVGVTLARHPKDERISLEGRPR